MFYFFVSFPIITVQPAIYNSYFRKICHCLRSFLKKNPAKQDSPPAAGRVSDILPFRRSAIRAERFLSYRNEVSYTIKRMCLGTFSRRGAVALATIYPCAECASSRSILSYGNEVSYTIKKGRICFPIRPFQIKFYFPLILLTPRTGCYTASHKNRSVQAASRGCPAR